jgi:YidC/Oxa1 family membrane protein insertase
MGLLNPAKKMIELLAQTSTGTLGYGVSKIASIDLNWIGQIIKWLIESVGIVGLGIVCFTLILKTIVLPLDIYSRIKTKKQALIMEQMRPQMEKLQKQYANDSQMYSQKVMELQKKNGYSMFAACIPMVVSLVIFMIVFSAFSTYSQYANLESYNNMVDVYNNKVISYVITDTNKDGFLIETTVDGETDYFVNFDNFVAHYNKENNTSLDETGVFTALAESYKQSHTSSPVSIVTEDNKLSLVSYYIQTPAAQAVAEYYQDNNNSFLWVGNLWYPDSMLNKEIPSFSKFQSTLSKATMGDEYEESYELVTAALSEQKDTYNGYFVLIVLSIAAMLLQQFISMKANKSVNDLSTVDGSGARTNKYMMIMMPIIYGVFAFLYSAAFSLYMITNTVYSIISTLIINKAMDVWFSKRTQNAEIEQMSRKGSRKN